MGDGGLEGIGSVTEEGVAMAGNTLSRYYGSCACNKTQQLH
jgi:hypothetical protein